MSDGSSALDPERSSPDVNLELPNVTKQNWKSAEIRDRWAGPLESFVAQRREVAKLSLTESDHPRQMLRWSVPSEQATEFADSLPDEIQTAVDDDGETAQFALTSEDRGVSSDAILADEVSSEEQLALQGVPDCCRAAYQRHRADGRTDPIVEIAKNTPSTTERGGEFVVESPYPILNPLWAFEGWNFVDFYPCSYECDEARAVAIAEGKSLRERGHGVAAEAAFEFLAQPTYWSGYHGLAHLKNAWCIGQYRTDDRWHEQTVRFTGYHEEMGDVADIDFDE